MAVSSVFNIFTYFYWTYLWISLHESINFNVICLNIMRKLMSPSSSINCESFWSSKRPQILCSVFLTLNQLFQSNCLFNMDERIYEFFKIIKIILQVQDAVSSETSDKLSSQFRKFVSLLVVFRPLLHIFHHKKGKR